VGKLAQRVEQLSKAPVIPQATARAAKEVESLGKAAQTSRTPAALTETTREVSRLGKEAEKIAATEQVAVARAGEPAIFTPNVSNHMVRWGSLGLATGTASSIGLAVTGLPGGNLSLISGIALFTTSQLGAAMMRPRGRRLIKQLMTIPPGSRQVAQVSARLNTIIREVEEETTQGAGPPSISRLGGSIPAP